MDEARVQTVFSCVKCRVLHTASESRVQIPLFYIRQMNPVCKMPCFTYDLGGNDVPVTNQGYFADGCMAGWYSSSKP